MRARKSKGLRLSLDSRLLYIVPEGDIGIVVQIKKGARDIAYGSEASP